MRRSTLAALALIWSSLVGAALPADAASASVDKPPAAIDPADLASFVDGFITARMKADHVVGVTVAVVHDGATIFERGYGFDDLAARRPVEPARSLFRPGSISKTFTWTAVMQLVEQGRLDLDADITTYLPNLEIAPTFDAPITLLDLMAHTPGYEDSAMGHLFGNRPDAVPALVDYLRAHRPARVRPPGLLPAYSNYGVAVAGLIVANVSGMAWEDYADRYLFEPLGMSDSTFREPWTRESPAPMPKRLRDNVSKGYVRRGGRYEAGDFEFIGQIGPAGALSATASDMTRWMQAHLGDGRLGEVRILEPETARRMHRQHFTMDPRMPGMAHGFIESFVHGYRVIGHGGGTIHFLSDMQLVPTLNLGVFISTNTSDGGGKLIDEFVGTLLERFFPLGPLSLAPAAGVSAGRPLGEYAGTYLSTRRPYTTVERMLNTSGATVAAGPDGLLVNSALGTTLLEPLGGDAFRDADSGQPFAFTSAADGAVNALLLPVPVMVLEKVGPLENPIVLYGVLAVSALVLACALVGAWLRRKRPPVQTATEAWAARLTLVTAAVWILFYAVALVGLAPLASDFAAVFFGFPSPAFITALTIALGAAVVTVLSALLLFPVWSTASWPLWRRLRHTGVVLAALLTLLILRDFNAIGFNYLS
ncbi:MAG: serine hydrolase domain-containing protein [Pseudomonadales bacterium]